MTVCNIFQLSIALKWTEMHTHKALTPASPNTEHPCSGDWLGEFELFRLEKKQVQGDLTAAMSVFTGFFNKGLFTMAASDTTMGNVF